MALLAIVKTVNLARTIQQALDCHRRGQLPQAERLYGDILAMRPGYFEALHMLALIKMQRGELATALRLMSDALQARPKSPEALVNYGLVLHGLGRNEEAIAAFDHVLSIKKRSVEAHNNRGAVLEKLGRDEEALQAFECALEIKSNHGDALYNKGSVLRKLGRHEEALKCLDGALAVKPNYARAYNNRGLALEGLNRSEEAIADYDRALAIDANFGEAINNRANALQKLGRHAEAVEWYDRALVANPAHAEVLNNRGSALAALGRHAEAVASCSKATALNPNYANAQWNESLHRLRLGDFAGGWEKYEWRWKRPEGLKKLRNFAQPRWRGEPVAGKTVLLYTEQGFGDTIQFARYAKLVVGQGARVILEVQPALKSLLVPLGEGIQVVSHGEELPNFDMQCPLLSVPLAFHTELATIPADVPYLAVPSEQVERWSARMPPRRGRRVGIVWSGNATHADDHNRSIALARLAPLFDLPDVQLISLQKGLRDADAHTLAAEPRIFDLAQHFVDFNDTAAAIAALDLVISVDTSVAHLAGALGKPVWVLLPFCPDWRWLIDRCDSPWYPSAELFRQPRIGDWESVIEQVRQKLSPGSEASSRGSHASPATAAEKETAAFAIEPPLLIGNPQLAAMALAGADLAPVWNGLVTRATGKQPDAAAFLDLATIAHIQGRPQDRAALRAKAFELSRMFRLPFTESAETVRVLAFMAGGDYLANMPIDFLLAGSSVRLDICYVAPGLPLPQSLPEHDAVFVAVAESDENQPILAQLASLLRTWPRPVINRPERVASLTRDGTYALLNSVPGLVVPVNVRVDRARLESAARGDTRIDSIIGGQDFPIIARPVDSHLGDGLEKLDNPAAIAAYLRQRAEQQFYVAPFIDYRQRDGFYRKYRVALIDERPYSVHMAVSRHWMINYINADMKESAEKRAEEAHFMAEFDQDFAVRHHSALAAIAKRAGLDYLPFDCSETADGTLLLFELGTNMIVHAMDPPDIFPYKRPQMEKVFAAFQAMLRKRKDDPMATQH